MPYSAYTLSQFGSAGSPGGGGVPGDGQVLYWDTTTNKALGSADFVFNDTLKQLILGTGSQLLLPNGTLAAPSLSFANSADSGLNINASNQLSFSTIGIERLRILSGGLISNVWIPQNNANLQFGAGQDTYFSRVGAGHLQVWSNVADTKLSVKAGSAQASNLQEWQNSSGTPLAYVDASGLINGVLDGGAP